MEDLDVPILLPLGADGRGADGQGKDGTGSGHVAIYGIPYLEPRLVLSVWALKTPTTLMSPWRQWIGSGRMLKPAAHPDPFIRWF